MKEVTVMALAQVLTAVRELILDERAFPETEAGRLQYLGEHYPALSLAEREDLAKITPDRLQLYTASIFAGERNLLKSKFPITFELMRRASETSGVQFDPFELVRDLHSRRPWRSAHVKDLVRNFVSYIEDDRVDLEGAEPALGEMARLEEMVFLVPRALHDTFEVRRSICLIDYPQFSLDDVVQLHGFLPSYVQSGEFSFDCPRVLNLFKENPIASEIEAPTQGKCWTVVGRTAGYRIRCALISPPMYRALQDTPRSQFFRVGELAERFLENFGQGAPRDESAEVFLGDLIIMNAQGALLLAH